MRRLTRAFAARLSDKYKNIMCWFFHTNLLNHELITLATVKMYFAVDELSVCKKNHLTSGVDSK